MQDPTFGGYLSPRPTSRASSIYSATPSCSSTPLRTPRPILWDDVILPPGFVPDSQAVTPAQTPARNLSQQIPRSTPRVHVLEVRYFVEGSPGTSRAATPMPTEACSPSMKNSRIRSPLSSSRRSTRFSDLSQQEEGTPPTPSPSLLLHCDGPVQQAPYYRSSSPRNATEEWALLHQRLENIRRLRSPMLSVNSTLAFSDDDYGPDSIYSTPLERTPARPTNPLPIDNRFKEVQELCPDSPQLSTILLPDDADPIDAQVEQEPSVSDAAQPAELRAEETQSISSTSEEINISVEEANDSDAGDVEGEKTEREPFEQQEESKNEAQGQVTSSTLTPDTETPPNQLPSALSSLGITPNLLSLKDVEIVAQPAEEVLPAPLDTTVHSQSPVGGLLDKVEEDSSEIPSLLQFPSGDPIEPHSAPSTISTFSPSLSSAPLRRTPRLRPVSCPAPVTGDIEHDARTLEVMKECETLEASAEKALDTILSVFLKSGQGLDMVRHVNALNATRTALGKARVAREAIKNGLEEGLGVFEDEASNESRFRHLCSLQRTLERLHGHADHVDGKILDVYSLNKSYERLHQYEDKLLNLADKLKWLLERLQVQEVHERLTQNSDEARLQKRALLDCVNKVVDMKTRQRDPVERTPGGNRASLFA